MTPQASGWRRIGGAHPGEAVTDRSKGELRKLVDHMTPAGAGEALRTTARPDRLAAPAKEVKKHLPECGRTGIGLISPNTRAHGE